MKITKILTLSTIATGLALTSCKKDKEEETASNDCSTVITNANGPQIGDSYVAIDAEFDLTSIDNQINISGSDKTWDFSTLTEYVSGSNDTIVFEAASNVPAGVTANLSLASEGNILINSSSTGLDVVSLDAESDLEVDLKLTNPLSFIPYSLEMNKNVTDEFVLEGQYNDTLDTLDLGIQVVYDVPIALSISQSNSNQFSVDGCGTVTTPKGVFSCLRYKVVPGEAELDITGTYTLGGTPTNIPQSLIDQIADEQDISLDEGFNMFEGTTYVWITKEHGYPLVEVVLDANGEIDRVNYLK